MVIVAGDWKKVTKRDKNNEMLDKQEFLHNHEIKNLKKFFHFSSKKMSPF